MTRATFTIAVFFLCIAAASLPPVTFESPCSCRDNHGEHRWAVKNDPSTPPTDASEIQALTPSDVFSWPGPPEHLTQSSARTGIENNWFALTGRVVDVKVEMDGDLHLAVQDATGDKAGIVVCEIPAKQQWCSIRETVFGFTATNKRLASFPTFLIVGPLLLPLCAHSPRSVSSNAIVRSMFPVASKTRISPFRKQARVSAYPMA